MASIAKGGVAAALLSLATFLLPARAEPVLKQPAPPLAVETVSGQKFDLAALRGKVVLVDFWATWCANCLSEFPALTKFYEAHRAQGFEIIALSVDKPAGRAKALRLASKLPFEAALLSDASRNGFGTPEAVPISYIIDANGIVRDRFIAIDGELLDEVAVPLLKEVRPLSADLKR